MAIRTENSAVTPTRNIEIQRQSYSRTFALFGGIILLGFAFYAVLLLQRMEAKLDALPQMIVLLTKTNDRLTGVSSQMEQGNANMKKLPPLLSQVNTNVSKISPPLKLVNHNVQGTAPT